MDKRVLFLHYLFIFIHISIKQVKVLEFILSVHLRFAFGSCYCEPTSCSQRSSPCRWNTIVRLQKQIKSIREIAGSRSTVWYILRKKICTGELSNIIRPGCPQRTTVVDDRRILSKNFHNIQPKEEHSPRGRRVTVKVYNQEKTSREQIQRVHRKVQTMPD